MPSEIDIDQFLRSREHQTPWDEESLLPGVPLAIKDNFNATYPTVPKQFPTTAGSKMLKNYTAPFDATVVKRLREQGATIIGKTTLDEFAMGSTTSHSALSEPCVNPWSLHPKYQTNNFQRSNSVLSPGGSSGGSAVAVASYCCFGALGSDTGGSVRQPASWNGIVGLKPSYGRLSRFGLIAFGSSLDCPAIFSRTVADAALILDSISGHDANDHTSFPEKPTKIFSTLPLERQDLSNCFSAPRKLRVGIPKEYWVSELQEEILGFWKSTSELMEKFGAEIVPCSLPHTQHALATYLIIANSEASSNLARYDGVRYGHRSEQATSLEDLYRNTRAEGFGEEVKRRILLGTFALSRKSYKEFFLKAQQVRRLIKEDFERCFQDDHIDILLTPTAPTTARTLEDALSNSDPVVEYLNDLMTVPANLAGIPAISLPVGVSPQSGLPIGMQLMSPYCREDSLLSVAYLLEQIIANK